MPTPDHRGQPAPDRYQPDPHASCQSDDPAEPAELDVMVHNKPQTEAAKNTDLRRDEGDEPFGRDSDEDLQGEQDLARQLKTKRD